jgi:hypothetical protein
MSDDIDYDLTPEQWETLKSLRMPVSRLPGLRGFALERLVALGLAMVSENVPAMTPKGRKALIRGSSKLWDVAA